MATPTPSSLQWENIEKLWNDIRNAKQTRDPQGWEELVGRVRQALLDWQSTVFNPADVLKKYALQQVVATRASDPDKKQDALDRIQALRDQMPANMRRMIDTPDPKTGGQRKIEDLVLQLRKHVEPTTRKVDDLLHSLEGIRQGDFAAYAGPVRAELSRWLEEQHEEQRRLQMLKRQINDRRYGVQDPERRDTIKRRITEIDRNIRDTMGELDNPNLDANRKKRLEGYIRGYERERKNVQRRLDPTKGMKPETAAKLQTWLYEIEHGLSEKAASTLGGTTCNASFRIGDHETSHRSLARSGLDPREVPHPACTCSAIFVVGAKLKSEEEIKKGHAKMAQQAKYDALLNIVTNIAHPVKVLRTSGPMKDQPTKPKFMPQQAPEELEGILPSDWTPIGPETKGFAGKLGKFGARAEYEPPKPKGEASECRIFVNLIDEGRFVQAKKFWQKQYSLQRGDLVELANHDCAGLRGCVRLIEANSPQVVVDLFKNDVITEKAVRVALYQVQPYL